MAWGTLYRLDGRGRTVPAKEPEPVEVQLKAVQARFEGLRERVLDLHSDYSDWLDEHEDNPDREDLDELFSRVFEILGD